FLHRSRLPPLPTLFPYTTLFRSAIGNIPQTSTVLSRRINRISRCIERADAAISALPERLGLFVNPVDARVCGLHVCVAGSTVGRSEEHTSELQSRFDLVCRLLLE